MATTTRAAARLIAAFGLALVAGCSTVGEPMATPENPSQVPSTPAPPSPVPSSSWPSGRPTFQTATPAPAGTPASVTPRRWQAILDDLAARGVTASPELVSAEAVTWNDSSLGCPSPGVMYTQALVDGLRVVVTADGTRYDYRFGEGDKPKLCQGRH